MLTLLVVLGEQLLQGCIPRQNQTEASPPLRPYLKSWYSFLSGRP